MTYAPGVHGKASPMCSDLHQVHDGNTVVTAAFYVKHGNHFLRGAVQHLLCRVDIVRRQLQVSKQKNVHIECNDCPLGEDAVDNLASRRRNKEKLAATGRKARWPT